MTDLARVDTIVIVMLENRSFDHMLGHLSYAQFSNGTTVDGLHDPLERPQYLNPYAGQAYYPEISRDGSLVTDLPHERELVHTQLSPSPLDGHYRMNGFVDAYYHYTTINRTLHPEPMGFLTPVDVPITNFLANQFAVCDRWFAALPASTQPNKIMAFTGDTPIDHSTGPFPKGVGPTFFDWLQDRRVPWRIYRCGFSFFALLGRFDLVFGPNCRPLEQLAHDVRTEPAATFPKVILVEPEFGDSPIHFGYHACDNHPPLAVGFGEHFLRIVYQALTGNPDRWARTLMVVTNDEHGGFYDHVPPLPIPYQSPTAGVPAFISTGLRVPALVVSPLVASRTVFSQPMDHTSILQLLADKVGEGPQSYSPTVRSRRDQGIVSLGAVLNLDQPRQAIPSCPDEPIVAPAVLGAPKGPKSAMQQAFENAAITMVQEFPAQTADQYPELHHWAQQEGKNVVPPSAAELALIKRPV